MGDRTALQVIVHDAHPDEISAIFEALDDEYGDGFATIEFGELLQAEEVLCGTSDELASVLANVAPRSCFTIWEDPKYEWLGSLNLLHRDLGRFSAECDAEGRALFNEKQVHKIVADDLSPHSLALATGSAWQAAFEDIDLANAGKTITRGIGAGATCSVNVRPSDTACSQCDKGEPVSDHGMCGSCLHNAYRSGWMPGDRS